LLSLGFICFLYFVVVSFHKMSTSFAFYNSRFLVSFSISIAIQTCYPLVNWDCAFFIARIVGCHASWFLMLPYSQGILYRYCMKFVMFHRSILWSLCFSHNAYDLTISRIRTCYILHWPITLFSILSIFLIVLLYDSLWWTIIGNPTQGLEGSSLGSALFGSGIHHPSFSSIASTAEG
jgi:hypothetical protein